MSLIEVIGIVSICVLIPALVIGFFMAQWHGFKLKDYAFKVYMTWLIAVLVTSLIDSFLDLIDPLI